MYIANVRSTPWVFKVTTKSINKSEDLQITWPAVCSTKCQQPLITSFSVATVKKIVLKPCANVIANSVIVRLENPELLLQVENAEQELIQVQANLR